MDRLLNVSNFVQIDAVRKCFQNMGSLDGGDRMWGWIVGWMAEEFGWADWNFELNFEWFDWDDGLIWWRQDKTLVDCPLNLWRQFCDFLNQDWSECFLVFFEDRQGFSNECHLCEVLGRGANDPIEQDRVIFGYVRFLRWRLGWRFWFVPIRWVVWSWILISRYPPLSAVYYTYFWSDIKEIKTIIIWLLNKKKVFIEYLFSVFNFLWLFFCWSRFFWFHFCFFRFFFFFHL